MENGWKLKNLSLWRPIDPRINYLRYKKAILTGKNNTGMTLDKLKRRINNYEAYNGPNEFTKYSYNRPNYLTKAQQIVNIKKELENKDILNKNKDIRNKYNLF